MKKVISSFVLLTLFYFLLPKQNNLYANNAANYLINGAFITTALSDLRTILSEEESSTIKYALCADMGRVVFLTTLAYIDFTKNGRSDLKTVTSYGGGYLVAIQNLKHNIRKYKASKTNKLKQKKINPNSSVNLSKFLFVLAEGIAASLSGNLKNKSGSTHIIIEEGKSIHLFHTIIQTINHLLNHNLSEKEKYTVMSMLGLEMICLLSSFSSVIEVRENAAQKIKKLYKDLSLKMHPDKVPPAYRDFCTERMQIINAAFDGLV